MRRFASLKQVPAETRRLLRDRFSRYLPSRYGSSVRPGKGGTLVLADEILLHLMLNLRFEFGNDFQRVRAEYESAIAQSSVEPALDDLLKRGWFRVAWGRISAPVGIAKTAEAVPVGTMAAFVTLLQKRFERTCLISGSARSNPELRDVVAAIDARTLEPLAIGCQSPEWVAARLWDRRLPDAADLSVAVRLWVDRWKQLGSPSLVPANLWEEAAASAFRETALKVLESDEGLVGWNEMRTGILNERALVHGMAVSDLDGSVPSVPITMVDRSLWLEDNRIQREVMEVFETCNDIFGLVRLLFMDVEHAEHAPAPHVLAGKLFALAAERPALLLEIIFRVRSRPVLIADLLLNPATSALACVLIGQWQSGFGAWDREVSARDDKTTKGMVFADAVSVVGFFLEQGSISSEEVASLLRWAYAAVDSGSGNDADGNAHSMLSTLRNEFAGQSDEMLRGLAASLMTSMPGEGLGTPAFAAALDIIKVGQLAGSMDTTPIVEAYIGSVAAGQYALSPNKLSVGGAAYLFEIVEHASPDLRRRFLYPVDMRARLATFVANRSLHQIPAELVRSIRAHVRILCRAITGRTDAPPEDLINTLIATIHAGALSHEEKGRIDAFSAQYETAPFRVIDRPIAADLGEALRAIVGDHQDRLLLAILEIDEPMVLAQLLPFAPRELRARIEQRVATLTPSEAGAVYSLTAAQARIEALLSAGLADEAARFIDAEQGLKTLGKVGGRELTRLRAELRLKLLRRDWTGIASTEKPTTLPSGEVQAATETLLFFKGLAALMNPVGDREAAEHMFAQLHARRPDVMAYAANLFAARISRLLPGNLFGRLHGAEVTRGRRVLADAEQSMLRIKPVTDFDSEIFICNKALILLALGEPELAYELLTSLHPTLLQASVAAYTGIALARMGRVPEALAALNHAATTFGDTDVLVAAREHIQEGRSFAAIANIQLVDDPVTRVKAALFDLQRMDPTRQAMVLHPESQRFGALATSHVRAAAASVISLVPTMKVIELDSREDDINALLRELLAGRLVLLGWSVADQSKGGFTAKGNPGLRDLVLNKDGTTLAVIEAVVCDRPLTQEWSQRELTSHFQKLPGYSTCTLFFHITYSYVDDPASVLAHLEKAAQRASSGFSFRSIEPIPAIDAQPPGFIARYQGDFGEIEVVFLVLNLQQRKQRDAAKTAAKTNPRN